MVFKLGMEAQKHWRRLRTGQDTMDELCRRFACLRQLSAVEATARDPNGRDGRRGATEIAGSVLFLDRPSFSDVALAQDR